jgi:hypothetical protein
MATRRAFYASVDAMCSEFAALHLLMKLSEIDTGTADRLATEIRNAWDAGDLIGELLYEHAHALGVDGEEVARIEDAWQQLPEVVAARKPQQSAQEGQ